jgi:hypothetical protein
MIPVYGFLEGDTIGLLVLVQEDDTMESIAEKLQSAAQVRVAHRARVRVVRDGVALDPRMRVRDAGIAALDRIDVVAEETSP